MKTVLGSIALFLGGSVFVALCAALGAGIVLWHAYVASILWGWFVVPLLPAVSTMAFWVFLTMVTFVRAMVLKQGAKEPERSTKDRLLFLAGFVSAPAIALLTGWVLR